MTQKEPCFDFSKTRRSIGLHFTIIMKGCNDDIANPLVRL